MRYKNYPLTSVNSAINMGTCSTNSGVNKMKQYRVLSIDAWGNELDGWDWNNWYEVYTFEGDIDDEIQIENYLFQFIDPSVWDNLYIDDDGYNIVLYYKDTNEPLYAIEYGCVI